MNGIPPIGSGRSSGDSGLSSADSESEEEPNSARTEANIHTRREVTSLGAAPAHSTTSSKIGGLVQRAWQGVAGAADNLRKMAEGVASQQGTAAGYDRAKEAINKAIEESPNSGASQVEGAQQTTAVTGTASANGVNRGYKEESKKFCEQGVIAKIAIETLLQEEGTYPADITNLSDEKKAELIHKLENFHVTGISHEYESLLLTFVDSHTLKLIVRPSDDPSVLTFKVVETIGEKKTAFRLNYHTRPGDWDEEIPAFKHVAKKAFEAGVFKKCKDLIKISEKPYKEIDELKKVESTDGTVISCLKKLWECPNTAETLQATIQELEEALGQPNDASLEELRYLLDRLLEDAEETELEDAKKPESFQETFKFVLAEVHRIQEKRNEAELLRHVQKIVEAGNGERESSIDELIGFVQTNSNSLKIDEEIETIVRSLLNDLINPYHTALRKIASPQAGTGGNLAKIIKSKIPVVGKNVSFQNRAAITANFFATVEARCFHENESLAQYQDNEFALVDNRYRKPIINITDVTVPGETSPTTYITSCIPQAKETIPTSGLLQNRLGLINFGVTTLATYSQKNGIVVDGAFAHHARPVPIQEKNNSLRRAKAHFNVLQAIKNQLHHAQLGDYGSKENPLVVNLDIITLLSPGELSALVKKGPEKENVMLQEISLAYETINNRVIEMKDSQGNRVYVKPRVNIQNFGINAGARYETGVNRLLNARGAVKLRNRAQLFFEENKDEDSGISTEINVLNAFLTNDSIKKQEEEIARLEEALFGENGPVQNLQKELNLLYKYTLQNAGEYRMTKEEIKLVQRLLSTSEDSDDLIQQREEKIENLVKHLQNMCLHVDKQHRALFSKNKSEIEKKIRNKIKTVHNEQETILKPNFQYALEEYIDFLKAAYQRGGSIRNPFAQSTVLEPPAILNSFYDRIGGTPYIFCKSGKDRTGFMGNYFIARRMFTRERGETPGILNNDPKPEKGKAFHRFTQLLHTAMHLGTARDTSRMNTRGYGLQIGGLAGVSMPKALHERQRKFHWFGADLGKNFKNYIDKDSVKKKRQEWQEILSKVDESDKASFYSDGEEDTSSVESEQ